MALAIVKPKEPESEEKPQKSLNEKQQVSRCMDVFVKITVILDAYLY